MQIITNGQPRNRCKPVPKKMEETSRSCGKFVALTSEGSDEDEIAEPEPPSLFKEASHERVFEKLTRFSLEDTRTVPFDGKLIEVINLFWLEGGNKAVSIIYFSAAIWSFCLYSLSLFNSHRGLI